MSGGYPDTPEKRKAGMAAFRRKLLAAHERLAVDPRLSEKDRSYQRNPVATIKAAQQRFGEAS